MISNLEDLSCRVHFNTKQSFQKADRSTWPIALVTRFWLAWRILLLHSMYGVLSTLLFLRQSWGQKRKALISVINLSNILVSHSYFDGCGCTFYFKVFLPIRLVHELECRLREWRLREWGIWGVRRAPGLSVEIVFCSVVAF